MSVHDLINRFAAAEQKFRAGEFFSEPVVRGGIVFVRVAGIICQFRVKGNFRGWGVFRPQGKQAKIVRQASMTERQRYFDLFPKRPMILVASDNKDWLAWPAHQADARFGAPTLVPVRLAEDVQLFDRIEARFDGMQCWFERPDDRADLAAARYLRDSFNDMVPPEAIARPRMSEERTAYRAAYELKREALSDRTEDRIRDSLAHAGAEYRGHVEQESSFRIEFNVDGVRHVSVINKDDFGVQLAGICLNGEDQYFDLTSLVGVLREANEGGVLRIGEENEGLAPDQYWAIHPPR